MLSYCRCRQSKQCDFSDSINFQEGSDFVQLSHQLSKISIGGSENLYHQIAKKMVRLINYGHIFVLHHQSPHDTLLFFKLFPNSPSSN